METDDAVGQCGRGESVGIEMYVTLKDILIKCMNVSWYPLGCGISQTVCLEMKAI